MPIVKKSTFEKLKLPCPPLPEQRSLARILDTIDEAISTTTAHIDKLKLAKAGLLHDLLTRGIDENGELRDRDRHPEQFKDSELGLIPKDWSVESASEVCLAVVDCKNRTPPIIDDGHPVIRTPNVREGRFVYEELLFTDHHSYVEWTRKGIPHSGDILITREAPVGEVCLLPDDLEDACLRQRMMMYKVNTDIIINQFMLLSLLSEAVQSNLLDLAGGSTVGHVRVGDIQTLKVHVPSVKEQIRIVESAQPIQERLTAKNRRLQKLKLLKQGLMSDLLTGRVRVQVDATEAG